MSVKCPKCTALIDTRPDELGLLTCGQCGARLRTKQPVKLTVQGGTLASSPSLPRIDPALAAPADVDHVLARIDTPSPDATIRPSAIPSLAAAAQAGKPEAGFALVLSELKAIRAGQQEILGLLRGRPAAPAAEPEAKGFDAAPKQRSPEAGRLVLLLDDDKETLPEIEAALRGFAAVQAVEDGNSALASIALEKPDAIVLELAVGGSMPGRDFVNLVKATMEWIDIPVVLHTRLELGDESGARIEHGADALVRKQAGSVATLAARLRALLSRN